MTGHQKVFDGSVDGLGTTSGSKSPVLDDESVEGPVPLSFEIYFFSPSLFRSYFLLFGCRFTDVTRSKMYKTS